jgi:anti-sigma28 factor (negative regulator of flagellin synthesis)
LSRDTQLLQSAMQAANQAPAVRADVVERLRSALDRGEIGNDPDRLAAAIIDRWLASSSDQS